MVFTQVMAALLIMESAMRPERLKPFWRLWVFPAPNPELAGAALLLVHVSFKLQIQHATPTCMSLYISTSMHVNHSKPTFWLLMSFINSFSNFYWMCLLASTSRHWRRQSLHSWIFLCGPQAP